MSRVACSWVDLAGDEDAGSWYLNNHIPSVVEDLDMTARNGEREASEAAREMFKDVAGIDGQYMTIYDMSENTEAQDIDAQTEAARNKFPEESSIRTRIYGEYATSYGEEWTNDLHDIEMFIVILWQPEDAIHDGFLDWLRTEFMPGVLESPEALRSSIYKLQPESLAQNAGTDTQDTSTMKPYMTIWEFDCEELPWEVLIFLARKEGWRCYVEGGQVQWQIAMYLVDRVYPK